MQTDYDIQRQHIIDSLKTDKFYLDYHGGQYTLTKDGLLYTLHQYIHPNTELVLYCDAYKGVVSVLRNFSCKWCGETKR